MSRSLFCCTSNLILGGFHTTTRFKARLEFEHQHCRYKKYNCYVVGKGRNSESEDLDNQRSRITFQERTSVPLKKTVDAPIENYQKYYW